MKSLWNTTISLCSLKVPVKVYSATEKSKPPFVKIDTRSMSKIGVSKTNKITSEPIPKEFVGTAIEINDSLHRITPEMIKSSIPQHISMLDFSYFVYAFDIPQIYFENFYYLLPEPGKETYYAYILQQLSGFNLIGLTQTVFRNSSTIFGLSCISDILILHKLRFIDQFIDMEPPQLPKSVTFAADFMDRFDAFLSYNTRPFYPAEFKDNFLENLILEVRKNIGKP